MIKFLDLQVKSLPKFAILTDDPMRVKMFAAHHLDGAICCNELRNMIGYTGSYSGVPLVVQSVGYGESSALVYLNEMVNCYGIKKIIYAGECVSFNSSFSLREVLLVSNAQTFTRNPEQLESKISLYEAQANAQLLQDAILSANNCGLAHKISKVHTDDRYGTYDFDPFYDNVKVIDFATYEIYNYAAKHNISALSVLTVSENALTNECMEIAERQSRFNIAARIVFETVGNSSKVN